MINAIRSNPVSLLVLLLALAAQVPHALTVFYKASHIQSDTNWWLSLTFAIALESAVLMFVIHGWHRFSYAFAASSILVNMAYYDMLPETFVKILVSVILPVAIACYSHLVANDNDVSTSVNMDWHDVLSRVKNVVTTRGRTQLDSTLVAVTGQPALDVDTDIDTLSITEIDNGCNTALAVDSDMSNDDGTGVVNDVLTPAQRRAQLSEIVIDKDSVSTDDIDRWSAMYAVSQRTIRRDIDNIFSTNGHHA